MPLNFHIGKAEIPLGLIITTLILIATAAANLFSKVYATKFGIAFTIAFFFLFTISERVNTLRHKARIKKRAKGDANALRSSTSSNNRKSAPPRFTLAPAAY